MGVYPVGSVIELSTGEIGIVRENNKRDVTRPWLVIITDKEQKPIPEYDVINLLDWSGKGKTIVKYHDPKELRINPNLILDKYKPKPVN